MTTFDSRQLPLLLNPRLSTPYAQTKHLLNHWKPTTKETNPGLQTPPVMLNADYSKNTIAINAKTTKSPRRGMGGVVTQGFA
jgi:hypothetical protein